MRLKPSLIAALAVLAVCLSTAVWSQTNRTSQGLNYTPYDYLNQNFDRLNQPSSLRYARKNATGCTTAASVGAVCTDTITLPRAFADYFYNAYCTCLSFPAANCVSSGVPFACCTGSGAGATCPSANVPAMAMATKTALNQVTCTTTAMTAAAAACGDVGVVAWHD